jgi:hypothetical protein
VSTGSFVLKHIEINTMSIGRLPRQGHPAISGTVPLRDPSLEFRTIFTTLAYSNLPATSFLAVTNLFYGRSDFIEDYRVIDSRRDGK